MTISKSRRVIGCRFVTVDIEEAEFDKHGTDVLVFEFNGRFRPVVQQWEKGLPMLGFVIGLTCYFLCEHLEIIRHNKRDFLLRPVFSHTNRCNIKISYLDLVNDSSNPPDLPAEEGSKAGLS